MTDKQEEDAARWSFSVEVGFPIEYGTKWYAADRNDRVHTGETANEALDAARQVAKELQPHVPT